MTQPADATPAGRHEPPGQFEESYAELRALAGAYLRRARSSDSLPATALVHEVYLRLVRVSLGFSDHEHFVRTAATIMRNVLVDHARARSAEKRGGESAHVTLGALDLVAQSPADGEVDVVALHEALERLSAWDPRQGQIVELRFFTGLSVEECARVLGISEKTVKRDWAMARAWLQKELGERS